MADPISTAPHFPIGRDPRTDVLFDLMRRAMDTLVKVARSQAQLDRRVRALEAGICLEVGSALREAETTKAPQGISGDLA